MPSPRSIALTLCFAFASSLLALERQPAAEYHARRVALAGKLHGGFALIFAANEPAMNYQSWRQDEDFYYLTGWNEPGAALLIVAALPAPPENGTNPGASTANGPAEAYREI